jgi:hypothetical protein
MTSKVRAVVFLMNKSIDHYHAMVYGFYDAGQIQIKQLIED